VVEWPSGSYAGRQGCHLPGKVQGGRDKEGLLFSQLSRSLPVCHTYFHRNGDFTYLVISPKCGDFQVHKRGCA
jgi:hypothetical protein